MLPDLMENYLADVLDQMLTEASLIKNDANSEFEKGRLFAYYEIISRLLKQAEAFGLMGNMPKHLQEYRAEDLLDK